MRIGGLASGMDIDSLVSKLISAERIPLDKLRQKKQVLEWQRDDYRSINTLLLDFRKELTNMRMTSMYRAKATTTTNDAFVTATASSAAGQSSFSISKVSQLATSERMLSSSAPADKLTFDPTKSLYGQINTGLTWEKGSVESKTISADGTNNVYSLGVTDVNLQDIGSWSVKVNGKGYKVFTDKASFDAASDTAIVYVDPSGQLEFKNPPTKDSSIRVDYIADKRTDTLKLSHNTSTLQLARGSINEVFSSGADKHIKLTMKVKEGEADPTETVVFFKMGNDGKVYDSDGITELGSLDKATGSITFDNEKLTAKGYLPPEKPEDGKLYDYNLEITYDQNYTTFSMDTETSKGKMHENFIVQGNQSISSLSSRVNSSSIGVSMFYDQASGRMSLSRTETGKFSANGTNDISVSGDLINNVFKFNSSTITEGVNAKFVINGIETERTSNAFTIDGVTFTLKQTFGDVGTSDPTASPVTVNVNNNGNEVFDNIVKFVNKYNELIDKIQKKSSEERYRKYVPLTDEQREAMSDKQQEMWDEKAKSGLLRRDPILSKVLSEMRMDFYQPVMNDNVSTLFNQMAELGITTGANYLDGGKLTINEAKLKQAIEDDPQSVENFFRGEGTTDGQKGVINRLFDTVTGSMDQLRTKAGNSFSTNKTFAIGLELDTIDTRITRFEARLKQVENRYWSQFTAMEKAIQRANEQSAYIMQMFGGN